MKQILLYTILLFASAAAMSFRAPSEKQRPDMALLRQEVSDPGSEYYYPKLMDMYRRNDTSMTGEQYRHLYLGTIFQENYNPYRHGELSAEVEALYYKENHTRAELDSIISFAERSLNEDPFDLAQINYLIFALRHRGKNNRADIWQFRLNHLLQAIISTGTGLDTDNAWYVINPRHEYNIINFMNCVADDQQFVEPYFDYISIRKTDSKQPDGYFFNIKDLLEEYNRKFPE